MNRTASADRFSAVLTFALLAGGTAAVGSALFDGDRPTARVTMSVAAKPVRLPAVEVTGRREAAAALPAVAVTGRREAATAAVEEPTAVASSAPKVVVRLPSVTVTGRRPDAVTVAASAQPLRTPTSLRSTCVEGASAPRGQET